MGVLYSAVGTCPRCYPLSLLPVSWPLTSRLRSVYGTVEAIFSAEEFVRNLPHSIEAVFIINPSDAQWRACDDALSGEKCEDYARIALERMRAHFGLSVSELPFVRFDPRNWQRPFTDVRGHGQYT